MKLHAKTIFVLLGMLLIGIAIGALGQSTMHNRRMEKINEMRRQGGLYASFDQFIDPVDQAQEDTLRALAKTYQKKTGRVFASLSVAPIHTYGFVEDRYDAFAYGRTGCSASTLA